MASSRIIKRRSHVYDEKPPRLRLGNRLWKPEALLDAVRAECLKVAQTGWTTTVAAEDLAKTLRAKKGSVTAALQKLVHEGIIGHKQRGYACHRKFVRSRYTLLVGNGKGEPIHGDDE